MHPPWLQSLLDTNSNAPKLYAWGLSDVEGTSQVPSSHVDQQKNNARQRIHILGVGNLGILFASSLASLPNPPPITLVFHRKNILLAWKREPGLEISRNGSVFKHSAFDVELWSEEPPPSGDAREVADGRVIQNLLVTTKASQALPEVDRVRRYLDGNSTVAFAQNGMCKMWPPHGTTYVSARYPHDNSIASPNWLACVTTHGVTSLGRFKSVHASEADVKVGPVLLNQEAPNSASYLSDVLTRAPNLHAKAVARDDLWVLQLEKLVVNSIINPLTAVLRCKNGQLFAEDDSPVSKVIDVLLFEASRVLQALINDRSADSILQADTCVDTAAKEGKVTRSALSERFSQPNLRNMLYEVGHKVRENTSSMLQDVRAGTQTEIDEFNGWLVDMASYLDPSLDVASHKILIGLVKNGAALEAGSLIKHFPLLAAHQGTSEA
ncbi:putative 2-dehydropantoate 2-reductase [Colletotrichum sojae]|uniref:Putative 2-dehydropantoate 2-reductase n=1 Tax=Colletotrichum sojae TaxID=2175907 RepID=A0A8H6MRS1_9PEZI|nr:putative 2-dehydropantoate 2-reductase [Colletotrichum sojae]